jgi:hypothetical protein
MRTGGDLVSKAPPLSLQQKSPAARPGFLFQSTNVKAITTTSGNADGRAATSNDDDDGDSCKSAGSRLAGKDLPRRYAVQRQSCRSRCQRPSSLSRYRCQSSRSWWWCHHQRRRQPQSSRSPRWRHLQPRSRPSQSTFCKRGGVTLVVSPGTGPAATAAFAVSTIASPAVAHSERSVVLIDCTPQFTAAAPAAA